MRGFRTVAATQEAVPAVWNRRPWGAVVRSASPSPTRHAAIANRRHGASLQVIQQVLHRFVLLLRGGIEGGEAFGVEADVAPEFGVQLGFAQGFGAGAGVDVTAGGLWPVRLFTRIPVLKFLRAVKEPAIIAFSTTSSDAALPDAFKRMVEFGVPKRIVSFVLPTG